MCIEVLTASVCAHSNAVSMETRGQQMPWDWCYKWSSHVVLAGTGTLVLQGSSHHLSTPPHTLSNF